MKQSKESSQSSLWQLGFMSWEFIGAVVGFLLLGLWLDSRYEKVNPWGTVVCVSLGVIGGMWNMIRRSIRSSGESETRTHKDSGSDEGIDS